MGFLVKLGILVLVVAVCQAYQDIWDYDGHKLKDTDYLSLWPMPQKVQTSVTAFKLSSSNFQIVHAKQSSAGPGCSLLQTAFRR